MSRTRLIKILNPLPPFDNGRQYEVLLFVTSYFIKLTEQSSKFRRIFCKETGKYNLLVVTTVRVNALVITVYAAAALEWKINWEVEVTEKRRKNENLVKYKVSNLVVTIAIKAFMYSCLCFRIFTIQFFYMSNWCQ